MPRYFLVLTFFLSFHSFCGAQIACPFVMPQPNAAVRVWDKPPLLLAQNSSQQTGQSAKEQSEAALLHFIHSNLRYPATGACAEGIVVIGFVIDTEGIIEPKSIRCVRSFHSAMGDEGLRIVKLMADLQMRWQPAEKDNERVRAQYYVPIRFRFE